MIKWTTIRLYMNYLLWNNPDSCDTPSWLLRQITWFWSTIHWHWHGVKHFYTQPNLQIYFSNTAKIECAQVQIYSNTKMRCIFLFKCCTLFCNRTKRVNPDWPERVNCDSWLAGTSELSLAEANEFWLAETSSELWIAEAIVYINFQNLKLQSDRINRYRVRLLVFNY